MTKCYYQLFAKGKQVWRFRSKNLTLQQKSEKISAESLEKGGWIWDKKSGKWYRFSETNGSMASRHVIPELPDDIARESIRWARSRFIYGHQQRKALKIQSSFVIQVRKVIGSASSNFQK